MSWVKWDDRYGETRKIRKAWRLDEGAVGLHVIASTHSALHETDGLVEMDWLEERMPDPEKREKRLALMTDVLRLFDKLPAGEKVTVKVTRVRKGAPIEVKVTHGPLTEDAYLVHDYLEFNEARQEADERRRAEAERKTKSRAQKSGERPDGVTPESERRPGGHGTDSGRSPDGVREVSACSTRPDPTRPDPTINKPPLPPDGGRRRDLVAYERILDSWAAERFPGCERKAVVGLARYAIVNGADTWDVVAAEVERQHMPARAAA